MKRFINYYTSHGQGCGIYITLIFVDSKALKQAHSKLATVSVTQSIGKKRPLEICIRDRVKYKIMTKACAHA